MRKLKIKNRVGITLIKPTMKKVNLRVQVIAYVFCLLSLSLNGQESVFCETDNNGFPVINVDETPLQVTHVGNEVQIISGLKDVIMHNKPGEPQIPWVKATLVLPQDASLESVTASILSITFKTLTKGNLFATPPYETWVNYEKILDWAGKTSIVDGKDTEIYTKDTFWPSVDYKILGTGHLRSYKIVTLAIPLAKYNPVTNEIKSLTGAKVSVKYKTSFLKSASLVNDVIGKKMIKGKVLNYPGTVSRLKSTAASSTYAIITTTEIQSASTELANFIAHKESRGFNVIIVTENDFGGGTGDMAAENIRAWLQANYLTQNIEYVLFIGNPDPSSAGVPMKMCWPRNNETEHYPQFKEAPTDMYYAELTSETWDKDGDTLCGEAVDDFGVGGIEDITDVYVGRIPYYGVMADLDAILAKTISYELDAREWVNKILLPMPKLDGVQYLGEAIKDSIASPNNWVSTRIYDKVYGLIPPPEHTPCRYSIIADAWKQSPTGMVVWSTHGLPHFAINIMNSYVTLRYNNKYPSFFFQASCENAWPEDDYNLSYSLLKNGGILTVGATRVCWDSYAENFSGTGADRAMAYEFTKNIIELNKTAGEALEEARALYIGGGDQNWWMNNLVFNIYGDPSLTVVNNTNMTTLQAEDQTWHNAATETKNSGYTGESYVNTNNVIDSWIEFSANVEQTGKYNIEVRIANGSTKERPMDVSVNGNIIGKYPGAKTGSWTTWITENLTNVVLNAGTNTIRLISYTPNGCPNVDKIDINRCFNRYPYLISPIPDQYIYYTNDSVQIDLNDYITDRDDSQLLFTAEVSNEDILSCSNINGIVTLRSKGIVSPTTVTISAHDKSSGIITDTINVIVHDNNAPNVVYTLNDTAVNTGEYIFVDISNVFNDPDNDVLAYSCSANVDYVNPYIISNKIRIYSSKKGTAIIKVIADDGIYKTETFFNVTFVNSPPSFYRSIETQYLSEGDTLTFDLKKYCRDIDDTTLIYIAQSNDPSIAITSVSGNILTVNTISGGETSVLITATDPEGDSSQSSFNLVVFSDDVDDPPYPVKMWSLGAISFGEPNYRNNISGNFADPESEPLTFSVETADSDIAEAWMEDISTLVIQPTGIRFGNVQLIIRVYDPAGNEFTDTTGVYINHIPEIINPIPDYTININSDPIYIDLDTIIVDKNDDDLDIYESVNNYGILGTRIENNILSFWPTGDTGTVIIEISIGDEMSYTETSFNVTVIDTGEIDEPPYLARICSFGYISFGDPNYRGDISSSFADPEGKPLTFTVETIDSDMIQAWMEDNSTLVIQPTGIRFGSAQFVIRVYDPAGNEFEYTTDIYVNHIPEIINPIPDYTININSDPIYIDLDTIIVDKNDDYLDINASFNNYGILDTRIENNILSFWPTGNTGTATLDIWAEDDISFVETSFNVTVKAIEPIETTITIQENEAGFCSIDGDIDNDHSGYTGTGYANTDNATGKGITWSINVPVAGTYSFAWRYAHGKTGDRTARLMEDGTTIISNISMPPTGSWSTWTETSPINVSLSEGTLLIRLEATSSGGLANIDYMEITGVGLSAVPCEGLKSKAVATSFAELKSGFDVTIFPNPVITALNIEFNKVPAEAVSVYLFDITGKPIKSFQTSDINNSLDMSGLPDGLYMIKISGPNINKVLRINKL